MKPRESLIRLKQFQVKEKRRQLGQLDLMMGEFDRMAAELDAQIISEENKAGITDINHFAYPTFAKAARLRRDNLMTSVRELAAQKEMAEAELVLAEAELVRAESIEERDGRVKADDRFAAGRRAM